MLNDKVAIHMCRIVCARARVGVEEKRVTEQAIVDDDACAVILSVGRLHTVDLFLNLHLATARLAYRHASANVAARLARKVYEEAQLLIVDRRRLHTAADAEVTAVVHRIVADEIAVADAEVVDVTVCGVDQDNLEAVRLYRIACRIVQGIALRIALPRHLFATLGQFETTLDIATAGI